MSPNALQSFDGQIAIVLGAGRGKRMGGPKALMDFGQGQWWLFQKQRLAHIGIDSIWVMSPDVHRKICAHRDAPERIAETDSSAPMFESVLAGLNAVSDDAPKGVFILPIDCPAPSRVVWEALIKHDPVSFPRQNGVDGHPLYMEWAWIAAHILAPSLHLSERRLDVLTRPVRQPVDVEDLDVGVNLNTPQQREQWISRLPTD